MECRGCAEAPQRNRVGGTHDTIPLRTLALVRATLAHTSSKLVSMRPPAAGVSDLQEDTVPPHRGKNTKSSVVSCSARLSPRSARLVPGYTCPQLPTVLKLTCRCPVTRTIPFPISIPEYNPLLPARLPLRPHPHPISLVHQVRQSQLRLQLRHEAPGGARGRLAAHVLRSRGVHNDLWGQRQR